MVLRVLAHTFTYEGLWSNLDFGFWVGIGTLGRGGFFQVGLENSLYKKYSNWNFYNFSLLVPYPIFFFVCFFVGGCLVARGWEDFNFLEELLY